jgi:hypothetical protein
VRQGPIGRPFRTNGGEIKDLFSMIAGIRLELGATA